jgi:phosphoribosylformimino-5-aminoimidazole carboxamide ribotide isomerase
MIVFPAIDILGGEAVRLRQGDYDQVTVYNTDPVEQAREWVALGAHWIHVVDLDGARDGVPGNIDVVERIVGQVGVPVQVGGGIRSIETMTRLYGAGATRMVLGTKLVTDPDFVREATSLFGDVVVAGVDARDGEVQIAGWREGSTVSASELVGELRDLGVRHLVYTDISRDGMQTGIAADAYRKVAAEAGFPVVASGGVSTLADIEALVALGPAVVEGVITGRALYEGSFTLGEALRVAQRGTDASAASAGGQDA